MILDAEFAAGIPQCVSSVTAVTHVTAVTGYTASLYYSLCPILSTICNLLLKWMEFVCSVLNADHTAYVHMTIVLH